MVRRPEEGCSDHVPRKEPPETLPVSLPPLSAYVPVTELPLTAIDIAPNVVFQAPAQLGQVTPLVAVVPPAKGCARSGQAAVDAEGQPQHVQTAASVRRGSGRVRRKAGQVRCAWAAGARAVSRQAAMSKTPASGRRAAGLRERIIGDFLSGQFLPGTSP